ncbi:MAG: hypothetical protein ABSG13_01540 [Bryobacteraceae bacterium]|jgi:hypothetical protein
MSAPSTKSGPVPESGNLSELILQVQDLQRRVLNLEARLASTAAAREGPVAAPEVPVLPPPLPAWFGLPPNTVPVLGRMLVAIAGAYVLRALTDWGVLPAATGVAIGLIYGLIWLWVAARSPVEAKFAAALSCSTSVLIIAPLVWEAAGRLKVMSAGTSSGVLAAFALVALVLGSRTQHRIIGTIAGVSSIVMVVALLLVRNDIVPFTTALLVIAAAMEFAACRDLQPGARAFAALAADSSVLLFSYLMSSPRGMPEAWIPVSPHAVLTVQLALALIYIGTAVSQTVVRRRTLAFAEMAQTGAALLIGIGGAVWVFKEQRAVMFGLGIATLAAGIAFYAVSFLLFERDNKRNFRALATFGLFLVLVGIFLPFSRSEFWILVCASAVACCCVARAFVLPTLGLHGAVYLLLGSAVAGATSQPLPVLFGIGAGPVEWLASVGVLLAAAVSWVAIMGISSGAPGHWRNQITSLALAAHVVWITAGLAAYAVLAMWRTVVGGESGSVPADTLATLVLTGLSLTLAWVATRWRKPELVWLLYGFMALGGYKLATRDFINEHNLPLVVSLLCYGGALIVLPRMLRAKSAAGDQ